MIRGAELGRLYVSMFWYVTVPTPVAVSELPVSNTVLPSAWK